MPYSPNVTPDPTALSTTSPSGLIVISAALSPAIVATITTAEQIFPIAGVLATDKVAFVNKPTNQAGVGISGARVSSAGNVAISFVNPSAGGVTPTPGEVYQIGLYRI